MTELCATSSSDFMPATDGGLPRKVLVHQFLRFRRKLLSAVGQADQGTHQFREKQMIKLSSLSRSN
jgi:hypothetical protein